VYQTIFWLTLIPGLGAALTFALLVQERARPSNPQARFWASLAAMPGPFRRFLVGVGVFGAGDFAPALLILGATVLLSPVHGETEAGTIAALLYGWRNAVYAAVAFPVGALGDRYGRRGLLGIGYVIGSGTVATFAATFAVGLASVPVLALLFALSGVYVAVEEALEAALTADLVPDTSLRGTAYGVMGTVNGVGDFLSSALVGVIWTAYGPAPGFAAAAGLMLAGAVLLFRVR
jgi:MFS family permease